MRFVSLAVEADQTRAVMCARPDATSMLIEVQSVITGRRIMATESERNGSVVHVRFNGRSFDVPMAQLDLSAGFSDERIKRTLSQFINVPASRLNDYVVDRHANGNLTLRPEAVFG
jgi:hypothetical protein